MTRRGISGQGAVKEATFVPRGSVKKRAVMVAREKERDARKDDWTGRSWRGVRELSFKTLFKNYQYSPCPIRKSYTFEVSNQVHYLPAFELKSKSCKVKNTVVAALARARTNLFKRA